MLNYILATNKSWHLNYFIENRNNLKGNWSIVTCTTDLQKQVSSLKPQFIFFPHWSEIVPSSIYNTYDCICFHMTDVPYGRGGSPLQNLVIRGHSKTMITALKMNKNIDAGPIYLKRELKLDGTALDIFNRTAPICFEMMQKIITEPIQPTEQVGKPILFKRRSPKESQISNIKSIKELYDLIRMLDAPGYPAAFLSNNGFKFEFSDAVISLENELQATVKVTKHE